MFIDWDVGTVSEYWGKALRCGKSGFTVNRYFTVSCQSVVIKFQLFILHAECNSLYIVLRDNLIGHNLVVP